LLSKLIKEKMKMDLKHIEEEVDEMDSRSMDCLKEIKRKTKT
jgi:hypothetical protein